MLKAIEIFKDDGKPTNLSIAHCHLAMILLQKGRVDAAETEARISMNYAKKDEYLRGQQMGKLILAEAEATRGKKQSALDFLESALAGFSKLGIHEGLNFEYAGRVNRLVGSLDQAIKYLNEGIEASQTFPIYLAALQLELARALKQKGSSWIEAANTAIALYTKHECPARFEMIRKEFGIS